MWDDIDDPREETPTDPKIRHSAGHRELLGVLRRIEREEREARMNTDPRVVRRLLLNVLDTEYPLSLSVVKRLAADRGDVERVMAVFQGMVEAGEVTQTEDGRFVKVAGENGR